jgi:hypothetical protein
MSTGLSEFLKGFLERPHGGIHCASQPLNPLCGHPMFEGRKLLIATKHEKEKVIAPILERELGVKCFTIQDFDTDELGTFSGEVERTHDALTTAREKCIRAMKLADCDLAVASEGSFGPHPSLFFAPADEELLVFIDQKNNLEVIAKSLSTATNFAGSEIASETALRDFAEQAKFPSHSLILKNDRDNFTAIEKGISDATTLYSAFRNMMHEHGKVYAETDMRAMHNPSRMLVIEETTHKLAEKLKTCCPECQCPGFSVTRVLSGLPCDLCNFPTRSTLSLISGCQRCGFESEQRYPHGKQTEDPMHCDLCNP